MTYLARLGGCTQSTATIWCWSDTAETASFTYNGTPYSVNLNPATNQGTGTITVTGMVKDEQLGRVDVVFSVQGSDDVYPYALPGGEIKTAWVTCQDNYSPAPTCDILAESDAHLIAWIGDIVYADNWNGTDYYDLGFSPELTHFTDSLYSAPNFTLDNFMRGFLQCFFRPFVRKMMKHKHIILFADDHETGIGDCKWNVSNFNTVQGHPVQTPGGLDFDMVAEGNPALSNSQIETFRTIALDAYWAMCGSANGFGTKNAQWGFIDTDYARLIFIDTQWFKSDTDGKSVNDPSMSILGSFDILGGLVPATTQLSDLKTYLNTSKQVSIFSPKKPYPSIIDSNDGWNNYRWERDEGPDSAMPYIDANATGVAWYTGDRHNPCWYSMRTSEGARFNHASFNSSAMDTADHDLGIGYYTFEGFPSERWKITGELGQRVDYPLYDPIYWQTQCHGIITYTNSQQAIEINDLGGNSYTTAIVLKINNFEGDANVAIFGNETNPPFGDTSNILNGVQRTASRLHTFFATTGNLTTGNEQINKIIYPMATFAGADKEVAVDIYIYDPNGFGPDEFDGVATTLIGTSQLSTIPGGLSGVPIIIEFEVNPPIVPPPGVDIILVLNNTTDVPIVQARTGTVSGIPNQQIVGTPPGDPTFAFDSNLSNQIAGWAEYTLEAVAPTKPTSYPDLINLPGDAGQQDLSSDWIGATSYQISGLPQGAHQVESSALVDFTFPSVNGWYDLSGVNVAAYSSEGIQSEVESFSWTVSDRQPINLTQKPQVLSEPFNNASGQVVVSRGAMSTAQWSQITFKVFDAAGDPVLIATPGIITGESKAAGQGGIFSPFTETLDLSAVPWAFAPNQAAIAEFRFSVSAALTAGYTVVATVNSWN